MLLVVQTLIQKRRLFIYSPILLMVTLLVIWVGVVSTQNTYYKGISIEGLEVSGLSKSQAKILIGKKLDNMYRHKKILLQHNENAWVVDHKDISLKFMVDECLDSAYKIGRTGNIFYRLYSILDIRFNNLNLTLDIGFDRKKLQDILGDIKNQVDQQEKSAEVIYANGTITIEKDIQGKSLDIAKNIALVNDCLQKRNFENIKLFIDEKKPKIVYNDVKGIDGVVAYFTTKFNSNDINRTHNIKLASQKINGLILKPADIFSMNNALGPRTIENGYKDAPVIYKNELIKGPGGGVCQVTTTLYGAALKAKLDILERVHHTLPLGYVEPGQDATIAEDYIDMKFQNSTGYSLCVSSEVKDSTLYVRLLGKRDGTDYTVKLRTEILEEILPQGEEFIIDDSVPDGQKITVREGKKGLKVVVYRETYDKDGNLIESEKISDDVYKPVKTQVKVNKKLHELLKN
ncbi:MAG: VanW family protein [Clostridia bacterium]|nr:VanW family protein [Clostridia bacterium]